MNSGDNYHFCDEFQTLLMAPPETAANSFTALLELPPNQAVDLLHCPVETDDLKRHRISAYIHTHALPAFPSDRASSPRATEESNTSATAMQVKCEPLDSEGEKEKPLKRKEREKKGKGSNKKSKTAVNQSLVDGEKLPYVHVRARRGQATDSHSLAERARRERINARMKFLQELVPGCNKISGTALVLEEIINHVQSLQRQVEYLSMRLAAVDPRLDFNLDSLISGRLYAGIGRDCI